MIWLMRVWFISSIYFMNNEVFCFLFSSSSNFSLSLIANPCRPLTAAPVSAITSSILYFLIHQKHHRLHSTTTTKTTSNFPVPPHNGLLPPSSRSTCLYPLLPLRPTNSFPTHPTTSTTLLPRSCHSLRTTSIALGICGTELQSRDYAWEY